MFRDLMVRNTSVPKVHPETTWIYLVRLLCIRFSTGQIQKEVVTWLLNLCIRPGHVNRYCRSRRLLQNCSSKLRGDNSCRPMACAQISHANQKLSSGNGSAKLQKNSRVLFG